MIPIMDLKRQYQALKAEIDAAVHEVLESGWFVLGRQVEAIEKEFAEYCGVRFAVVNVFAPKAGNAGLP